MVWTGVILKKNDAGESEGVVWWGLEGGSWGGTIAEVVRREDAGLSWVDITT